MAAAATAATLATAVVSILEDKESVDVVVEGALDIAMITPSRLVTPARRGLGGLRSAVAALLAVPVPVPIVVKAAVTAWTAILTSDAEEDTNPNSVAAMALATAPCTLAAFGRKDTTVSLTVSFWAAVREVEVIA